MRTATLSFCYDSTGITVVTFFISISFIFNFLFHNLHDKFDRQIIVSNQINQIESWIKHRCCAWVQKRVCHHRDSNSQPRAWCSVPMIRAKCDITQLFRCPYHSSDFKWGLVCNFKSALSYFDDFVLIARANENRIFIHWVCYIALPNNGTFKPRWRHNVQ